MAKSHYGQPSHFPAITIKMNVMSLHHSKMTLNEIINRSHMALKTKYYSLSQVDSVFRYVPTTINNVPDVILSFGEISDALVWVCLHWKHFLTGSAKAIFKPIRTMVLTQPELSLFGFFVVVGFFCEPISRPRNGVAKVGSF